MEAVTEAVLHEFKGLSIFRTLKQNGLRGLEDDLYEYKVRVKNVQDQSDAIYIMRCINYQNHLKLLMILKLVFQYQNTSNICSPSDNTHLFFS